MLIADKWPTHQVTPRGAGLTRWGGEPKYDMMTRGLVWIPWRHLWTAPYLKAWFWEEQCTMGSDGIKQRQLFGNQSRLCTIKPIVNKISTLTGGPIVLVQMTYVCSWAVVKHSTSAWAGKSTKNKLQATREANIAHLLNLKIIRRGSSERGTMTMMMAIC